MLKFTAEQIQSRFEKLPKEIQDAITSADVHDNLMAIAKKYTLHIDQEGDLVDQVGLIMLGLSPSKEFVKNFSAVSGVDTATAVAIAGDINSEIFGKIRSSMRNIEEKEEAEADQQIVSEVERVGEFDIEPRQGSDDQATGHIESRDRLINSIENPPAVEIDAFGTPQHNNTEPFIDHLLSGPVVTVAQKTTKEAPAFTPKSSTKPSGPDVYREPID